MERQPTALSPILTRRLLQAGLHIAGVSVGIHTDKSTWDIQWIDQPSAQDIATAETILQACDPAAEDVAEQWRLLRIERNMRLAQTDWSQLSDVSLTSEQAETYRAYRQALRDLPSHTGDPSSPNWPTL